MHAQSRLFCLSKLIAFLPFSLPSSSLRELPILKPDNYNCEAKNCDSSVKYNSTYDSSQKQFPRIKRREKKLPEGSVARLQNYKMVRIVFDLEMDWFFFRLKPF